MTGNIFLNRKIVLASVILLDILIFKVVLATGRQYIPYKNDEPNPTEDYTKTD